MSTKVKIILYLMAAALMIGACSKKTTPTATTNPANDTGIANPASVNCEAKGGKLEIHDPRRLADISPLRRFGFAGSMLIEPSAGKLVMIPAWMEHTIHPFFGPGELVWVSALAKMTGGRDSGLRSPD